MKEFPKQLSEQEDKLEFVSARYLSQVRDISQR